MASITQGELKVKTAIPLIEIQNFRMEIKKNSHAYAHITGVVPNEAGDSILFQPLERAEITIYAGEDILFSGKLKTVHIEQEGKGYIASLDGVSNTELLDYEKKNRTFQKEGQTYREVMREAAADTAGAGIIFSLQDRTMDAPVYQIEETDWEFIRRLASHLSVPIVPSAVLPYPGIYVGLPKGSRRDGDGTWMVREKLYYDRENHCICRDIMTYENWDIGDRVGWQGMEYAVIRKSCVLKKGLLCFTYSMAGKEAFAVRRYGNPYHTGLLLPAEVLETKEERVRVRFDMDKGKKQEDTHWYPWRPDMGNLVYCMPEKGEHIYIHMGDCEGKHASAVCGIHENAAGNPEMKTTHRYFTTAYNKRMYMSPDAVGFKDLKQTSPLGVELNDQTGIEMISNKKVIVSAKDTIAIKGADISIQAPQEISIVRRDMADPTVINMCNGFDSIGATNEVTMAGAGDAGFPVFHETEQETGKEYGLDGLEKDIIASTPGMGMEARMEKQIEGIRVDKMTGRWDYERNDKDRRSRKESGN